MVRKLPTKNFGNGFPIKVNFFNGELYRKNISCKIQFHWRYCAYNSYSKVLKTTVGWQCGNSLFN